MCELFHSTLNIKVLPKSHNSNWFIYTLDFRHMQIKNSFFTHSSPPSDSCWLFWRPYDSASVCEIIKNSRWTFLRKKLTLWKVSNCLQHKTCDIYIYHPEVWKRRSGNIKTFCVREFLGCSQASCVIILELLFTHFSTLFLRLGGENFHPMLRWLVECCMT